MHSTVASVYALSSSSQRQMKAYAHNNTQTLIGVTS